MVAGFLDWVTIFIKLFSKLGSEAAISQHCVRSFVSSGTASRKKKQPSFCFARGIKAL